MSSEAELSPESPNPPAVTEFVLDYSPSIEASKKRLIWAGFLVIFLGLGGLGAWAALAPLQSAALASGIVKVASERKTVQHLSGGIVKEILVKEGDEVAAGQVLVRLDGVAANARAEMIKGKQDSLTATMARLQAEREGLEAIEFPEELLQRRLDHRVARLITGEEQVFKTRREALQGEMDVLQQRIVQYEEQIAGLEEQIASTVRQLGTVEEERKAAYVLYKKGIYEKPKYLRLVRGAAKLEGEVGAHRSSIAQVKQKIAEVRLRVIDIEKKRREEIDGQLQRVQTDIFENEERLRAAVDILERIEIRAPQDGTVVGLSVHTVGGVIQAGSNILDIVPRDDMLVIEARVRPQDIDIVHEGLAAEVRLTAFNMRTTPVLPGRVTNVSADSFTDRGNESFYRARIEIDPAHVTDIELYPGMPAEVYLLTGERTMLTYLIKPIKDSMHRGFLEQ